MLNIQNVFLSPDTLKFGIPFFVINPLKIEFLPNHIYKFSSYLTRNILLHGYESNRLMLFGETVAVYCENHTEHTDTLCEQNAEFSCAKAGGTYSDHWALKG
jgi:hypothetical protein